MGQLTGVICLDFDGVIVDSIDECFETSFGAYKAFTSGPITGALESRRAFFRTFRKYVRPAGEYLILHLAFDAGMSSLSEEEYDAFCLKESSSIEAFTSLFFGERNRSRKENMDAWLSLNRPYGGAKEGLVRLMADSRVFIVTTKDSRSVELLLGKMDVPFPKDDIYGNERHSNKAHAIKSIATRLGTQAESLVFVDDHPAHLKDVEPATTNLIWASWGYYDTPGTYKGVRASDWADLEHKLKAIG